MFQSIPKENILRQKTTNDLNIVGCNMFYEIPSFSKQTQEQIFHGFVAIECGDFRLQISNRDDIQKLKDICEFALSKTKEKK